LQGVTKAGLIFSENLVLVNRKLVPRKA